MGGSNAVREKALFSSQHAFDSRMVRAFLPVSAAAGAPGCAVQQMGGLVLTKV